MADATHSDPEENTKLPHAICALCRLEKRLRNSHIVPEFMYKRMYKDRHEFYGLYDTATKTQIFQKGLRQKLLCGECEGLIGSWENYASRHFYGKHLDSPLSTKRSFHLHGLEYAPLKLFYMSLLWRYGVTTINWYKGVELGEHRERLREMIASGDPGDPLQYPCFVTALTRENEWRPELIFPPQRCMLGKRCIWALPVSGYLFRFLVSNRPPRKETFDHFLQKDGRQFVRIREIEEFSFLVPATRSLGEATLPPGRDVE